LVFTTELEAAAGPHASVAPAKFASSDTRDKHGTYAYEPRFLDGHEVDVVLIDSKQSQLNRIESEISRAILDGVDPFTRVPRIQVTYETPDRGGISLTDLDLPHRAFDAHVRAGTVEGQPVTANPRYRAARDASPANARALLELSPGSLVFGSWDATRKANQGRWRSALVGEIVGVVNSAPASGHEVLKGGARVDPVAMQIRLTGPVLRTLVDAQREELSVSNVDKLTRSAKGDNLVSASGLGLGGIPPTLAQLAGVSCSRILRSHVLSFAALRQVRFGFSIEGDAACRVLLAAYALAGLTRSNAELYLRANCDLREKSPTKLLLDQRQGALLALDAPTVAEADALLCEAIDRVQGLTDLRWDGQIFEVVGNPAIVAGAIEEEKQN
jgi:CRISPR-associated protein Csb1